MKYRKADSCLYNELVICRERDRCAACAWRPETDARIREGRVRKVMARRRRARSRST